MRWIKCEDQSWINLGQMTRVYVAEYDEDGEFKLLAEDANEREYQIAGYPTPNLAYEMMDQIFSAMEREKIVKARDD